MKSIKYIFVLITVLLVTGCKTGVYTSEGGKSDVAYLSFTSSNLYANKVVTVTIDNATTFEAKVVKEKKNREKYRGEVYAIAVGRKMVKVTFEGEVLYDKEIYVTTQQTKNIELP